MSRITLASSSSSSSSVSFLLSVIERKDKLENFLRKKFVFWHFLKKSVDQVINYNDLETTFDHHPPYNVVDVQRVIIA